MSIESVIPSNGLILCRPLLLLPSIFPSVRVFSNEVAQERGTGSKGRPGRSATEMGRELLSVPLARLPSCVAMLVNKLLLYLFFLLPRRAVEISQNPTTSRKLGSPLVQVQLPGGLPLSQVRWREMMWTYPIPHLPTEAPSRCLWIHCLICHMVKAGHGPLCQGPRSNTQRQHMGTSLVIQGLRLRAPNAGAKVQVLFRGLDPTRHN